MGQALGALRPSASASSPNPLLHFHGRKGVKAATPRRWIPILISEWRFKLNVHPPNEAGQAQVLPLAPRKLERGAGRGEGAVFFRCCLCDDGRASVSEFGLKRVSAPRQAQRMGRPIPARCDGPADFGGTAASGQRSPALNHPSSVPTQGGLGRKHLSGTLQLNCKSGWIQYGNDPFLEPLNPTAYSSSWQLRQGTARPARRYSKVELNCYSSRISQRLDDPIEGGKIAPGSFCERASSNDGMNPAQVLPLSV